MSCVSVAVLSAAAEKGPAAKWSGRSRRLQEIAANASLLNRRLLQQNRHLPDVRPAQRNVRAWLDVWPSTAVHAANTSRYCFGGIQIMHGLLT